MAKINRFNGNLKAPASESLGTERTIFGEVTQSDDITDQFTNDLLRGWGIVGPSDEPTLQDFNAMGFTLGQLHAYLHQVGVAEWNVAQEYHEDSFTNRNGVIYLSLVNDNIGNDPESSPSEWEAYGTNLVDTLRIDIASAASVDLVALAPNSRDIRVTGSVSITSFVIEAGQRYFVTFSGAATLTNGAPIVTNSGANIVTAAGDTCIIRATAANVIEVMCYTRAAKDQVIHVQDQKASGTAGGTFTSGAWRTRDLNTVLTNTISGASLATNQITLPAGTYEVMACAPSVATDSHQARAYNATAAATLINGTNAFNAGGGVSAVSLVIGRFTLASTSNIELQHACQTTAATTGFGVGNTLGGLKAFEVYSDVIIRKVS